MRQRAFVQEYLVDLNATRAYTRAGYKARNPAVARANAARLIANDSVRAAIEDAARRRMHLIGLTGEAVIRELAHVALADPVDAFYEDGSLKPLREMPEELRRAVSGIDVVEMAGGMKIETEEAGGIKGFRHVAMYTKKLRFWDKNTALKLLAEHMALLHGLVVSGPGGGPIQHEHRLTKEQADAVMDAARTFEGEVVKA
jgi:phage terminase small subunit